MIVLHGAGQTGLCCIVQGRRIVLHGAGKTGLCCMVQGRQDYVA